MKRAKLFLTGIAIVTVVCGTFAFKSANFLTHKLWVGTTENACNLRVGVITTIPGVGNSAYFTTTGPTSGFTPCTATTYTTTTIE